MKKKIHKNIPVKKDINSIENLVSNILVTNYFFFQQAQKQVNTALTMRNFIIGYILTEFELNGAERAKYGKGLFKEIAQRLEKQGLKYLRERHLYLCKDFYLAYPDILRTASAKYYLKDTQKVDILRTVSAKSKTIEKSLVSKKHTITSIIDLDKLINRLSFSHIIELLKADKGLKRNFYETETIKNNWSVRELQRAMNSMLYERTGLSKNKNSVIQKNIKNISTVPENVFRNPYILEFLNIEERVEFSESDLEQAILNHIQNFLIELGKGFCFESRQKRITFDNKHYRIDLVFYNRILKCNVLFDLKIGEFEHADAGQMNVYLNYFRENEMCEGDNPPIGIILCAHNNANLVKYATAGLSHKIFVNKYLVNLPNEDDLKNIIEEEQNKIINLKQKI
ncbi:MAG TPA: PDDEXK nuclease domain-containing protein [Bacteroidales bacterium]|nr:PDDEXK nuclease domain-containing protein [Bacteroidales bacterium]HPS17285.1 PDDEXK nuclease domain-containing protein [Bacteroidales bacterium]